MNEKVDPREWWCCENDFCRRKLAKVLKNDDRIKVLPEIIEIQSINGSQFQVLVDYVEVYCRYCGTKNELHGTKPWDKDEWQEHCEKIRQSGMDRDWGVSDGEFLENPFKRNLLLKALATESQRRLTEYLCEHLDGEWAFEDAAKELGVTKDILLRNYEAVDLAILEIEAELRNSQAKKYLEDAEETRKRFSQ
jgi:hypothetical protein